MVTRSIEQVLKDHTEQLMALVGVVGVAQSLADGLPCIKVYVDKMTSQLQQQIPGVLEGYPVVLHEIGQIEARGDLN